MNQEVTLFVIGQAVIVGGVLFSIYVKVATKMKELEIRLRAVEKQDDTILKKLDHITDKLNEISIELTTKQDKP